MLRHLFAGMLRLLAVLLAGTSVFARTETKDGASNPPLKRTARSRSTDDAGTTPALLDIAQGYIHGYPIVLFDQTRVSFVCQPNASMNTFDHVRQTPDATFDTIVRPNVDTLYSSAFLDVRESPIVLTIPPTDGRYMLVALFDAWSNNFAGVSTLDGIDASKGGAFVVAWEGWQGEVPPNATRFDSPTPLVWLLLRTLLLGDDDVPNATAIQDGMTLEQLQPVPASPGLRETECPSLPPPDVVASMSGFTFFSELSRLLEEQGALLPGDAPMLATLATFGVGPSSPEPIDSLSLLQRAQLQVAAGLAQSMLGFLGGVGIPSATGWSPDPSVPLGDYGTDYLLRALVAAQGFGANRQEFAVYQNAASDADDMPLDGQHAYTLTFPADELPPVDGFWSLTVYNSASYLAANDLNRYALGSSSPLVTAADGSTVLVLSHAPPRLGPQENWLPVADEPFSLTLRMYGPSEAILSQDWVAPRPRRVATCSSQ